MRVDTQARIPTAPRNVKPRTVTVPPGAVAVISSAAPSRPSSTGVAPASGSPTIAVTRPDVTRTVPK